ncbi:cell division and transport-associated protein TolA [Pseudomonas sp. SLBN-26]|uniref:cell envelope integrity protein TolA n=1 Tax=Pseudomonadaceae TaxID=135621 RepID=UPI001153E389|nr:MULTISPECIES: cell envelope integrity protein TolA [Pseudomonas]MCP1620792.1 colicin import membrane protein [Pseudomonas otitidis]TQL10000.1 cell division and transport-associated protein TolA [Pseudomonas sp. SLBN-26]
MHQQSERSPSESYFWPVVWAVGLHVLIFGMLFVSFAFTPELPPARPIVQATLYQLKSQSQATTQTNQKIAGEAKKTAAPMYEAEQLEMKKAEEQKVAAAKAAEQKKAEEARKAAEAKKAEETKKAEDAKKAAEEAAKKQQADIAKKKAEEEAKKKAEEEAKKKAAEEAKKKAAEDAKKKAAEEAKKKAAEDAKKKAAEEAKKKAAEEAKRKAARDQKAAALAELLGDKVENQQAPADEVGDTTSGNYDDLIRLRVSELWTRPPSARNGMSVQVQINMLPDGTITNATVVRSSGDPSFDQSAVSAVRNVGRIPEMQGMKPSEFNIYRSFKMTFTPEDLE